jgi:transcriptional regulator with XRE-family HTH domain
MALFFDGEWFDARLASAHLSRDDVARALGLSDVAFGEIWKDQRELSAKDVTILAALLAATPQEIAIHAGISTPVPRSEPTLSELAARLEKVEADVAQLRARLKDTP